MVPVHYTLLERLGSDIADCPTLRASCCSEMTLKTQRVLSRNHGGMHAGTVVDGTFGSINCSNHNTVQ